MPRTAAVTQPGELRGRPPIGRTRKGSETSAAIESDATTCRIAATLFSYERWPPSTSRAASPNANRWIAVRPTVVLQITPSESAIDAGSWPIAANSAARTSVTYRAIVTASRSASSGNRSRACRWSSTGEPYRAPDAR